MIIKVSDFFGDYKHMIDHRFETRKDVADYIRKWKKNGAKIVHVKRGMFRLLGYFNIITIEIVD